MRRRITGMEGPAMRKIISGIFITLDGVVEAPENGTLPT